jgi:hypothetical protein
MGTDKGHSSGHYQQVETDVIIKNHDKDHKCDQLHRLDKIERRLERHEAMLSDGRNEFTAVRKDIQHLTEAINAMRVQLEKVIATQAEVKPTPISQKIQDAVIFWAVPIVGGALLWAIMASGQIPRGVHP